MENISKILVLNWDQCGSRARKLASILSAAFPQAKEDEIQAAAWVSVGHTAPDKNWDPYLVRVPDEATDAIVLTSGDEYLSSEWALAVVDGKIVDCKDISAAEAEHLLPSELMATAHRIVDALQQWGEYDDSDGYDSEDEDDSEGEDNDPEEEVVSL